MNSNSLFNPQILDEYFANNRLAKINFIEMFEKSIKEDTEKLIISLKKQDNLKISEAAHKLKSSFNYIDITSLSDIYSNIEKQCEQTNVNYLNILNLLKTGQRKYDTLFAELNAYKLIL